MTIHRLGYSGVLLGFLAVSACSTTATISRSNGPDVEAKIVGGDARSVYVASPGGPQRIPKAEITDIDHPGDTVSGIGGGLLGYGVLNIAVGVGKCDEEGAAFCTGVFLPAAVGLPMVIWGLSVHFNSKGALNQRPPSGGSLRITPVAAPSEKDGLYGGVLELTF